MSIDYSKPIVCSANKYGRILLLGVRHWDPTMLMQKAHMDLMRVPASEFQLGFLNTAGEFLSRQEAWMAASNNQQIKYLVGVQKTTDIGQPGNQLLSENLY